ncbi:hypothetical protein B0H13DRAFT_1007511 [Mycena leptocephala]|nr:hypothetical protein B0H13DRAFT_1007511 [Mycena leptocephala]
MRMKDATTGTGTPSHRRLNSLTRTRPSTSMALAMRTMCTSTNTTADARMPRASARAWAGRGRSRGGHAIVACVSYWCLPFYGGPRLVACAIQARVHGLWVCARRPSPSAAQRFNSPLRETNSRLLCAFQMRDSHCISEVGTSKGASKARSVRETRTLVGMNSGRRLGGLRSEVCEDDCSAAVQSLELSGSDIILTYNL